MNQGWVPIHRQIRDHWLWKDKPFTKGQAWVDMILRANHEDTKFPYENEIVDVPLGSFFSSETALADDWGWSRKKVHGFIDVLTKDGMLGTKRHRKGTVFFLINYSNFSSQGTAKEPQKNRSGTAVEPQWNTYNNDNNENNLFSSLSEREIEQFCFENNLKVDAKKFLAHYRKTGWLDKNGNQIQDWKAAVTYWSLNEKPQKGFRKKKGTEPKEPPSFDLEAIEKQMRESYDIV